MRVVQVPPKPPGARRLARMDEACAYGKFSRTTLWRLIHRNKVKAYRQSPRMTMIDLDSIDTFQNNLPELKHATANG